MEDIFKNIQIYHTLEEDYEDWKSFRKNKKLKLESDRDNDKSDKEEEIEQKNEKKDKKGKAPKGTSSTLSSRELRSLLSDATPTKKWQGSIQYENQDELYDALDNVLTKLKNHNEHSDPFLNRVRKSDAPDYYDIIKHPMDLGTMTKKLYRCEYPFFFPKGPSYLSVTVTRYSSKAEFQNDINLIFSNCRTYNTDPSAKIYLVHCDALEKKAKELMKNVKNIDFSQQRKETEEVPTTPTSPKEESKKKTVKKKNKTDKKKKKKEESDTSDVPDEEPSYDASDLVKLSQVERYRYLKYRQDQCNLPFAEREALVRDPLKMASFVEATSTIPGNIDTYDLISNLNQSREEEEEDGFFPEITHFTSSIPDLYQPHTPLSPYAAQSPPVPKSLYQSSLIKSNSQLENLVRNFPAEAIGDEISVFPEEITVALLKKSIAILCAHGGFEGTEENALDVLTDIISDYLLSLGKLLRANYDNYSGKLDTLTLLNMTLKDIRLPSNGHNGIPSLHEYIKSGHATTGRFKQAVEVAETQQTLPTEHVSMLLDEETSQHIEKDPLDPLNDDYFPEKIATMQMNFEKAQSLMNTQQQQAQQQQQSEEKEGGPLKRTKTQEEIVPAPAPSIPAAEEVPPPVERKGPRRRNMPNNTSKRGKRKETY